MKYRVKKVTWVDDNDFTHETYYPQYKFLWWHYYTEYNGYYYYDRKCFSTIENAVNFIKLQIKQKRERKVKHIYLNLQ